MMKKLALIFGMLALMGVFVVNKKLKDRRAAVERAANADQIETGAPPAPAPAPAPSPAVNP